MFQILEILGYHLFLCSTISLTKHVASENFLSGHSGAQ